MALQLYGPGFCGFNKSEQNCSKNFITFSHKRGGEVEHAGLFLAYM